MSDTFGSLADKLCICNIKLFMVQDEIHAAAKRGEGLTPELTRKVVDLNLQRNQLMTELDQMFADAIRTGHVTVDPRVKIL